MLGGGGTEAGLWEPLALPPGEAQHCIMPIPGTQQGMRPGGRQVSRRVATGLHTGSGSCWGPRSQGCSPVCSQLLFSLTVPGHPSLGLPVPTCTQPKALRSQWNQLRPTELQQVEPWAEGAQLPAGEGWGTITAQVLAQLLPSARHPVALCSCTGPGTHAGQLGANAKAGWGWAG